MSWLIIILTAGLLVLIPTAYAGLIGAPFVPTRRKVLIDALDYIKLGAEDTFIDLGAGSGTTLIEAHRRGAKTIGYELSPIMWLIARLRTVGWGTVHLSNFFHATLPPHTTVIFTFLIPRTMPRLKEFLAQQQLPQAKYLLSFMFKLPNVAPHKVIEVKQVGKIYIYDLPSLIQ